MNQSQRRRAYSWSPTPPSVPPQIDRSQFIVPLPAESLRYPWVLLGTLATTAPQPAPRGILYPSIAAGDSVILFDMRKDPSQSKRDEYLRHHRYSIFSNAVKHIRLVCKDFPWQIEIHDEWITCGTIWKRLYGELQEYITEAEWTMMNESRQEVVKKAMKLREAETGIMEMRPKRIDWLDKPMFGGLEKDESFVQRVTWSGKKAVETWVIRLM